MGVPTHSVCIITCLLLVSLHFIAIPTPFLNFKFLFLVSLSTVVLNSTDRLKNIWLPKGMHLGTQWFKIQNTKKTTSTL